MRIIKEGIHPNEIVHQGTCTTCKTEVEFKRSEGEVVYDQRDGDYVKVACPICGGTITSNLRYEQVPK